MDHKDEKTVVSFHEKIIEKFIEGKRPPKEIRNQVDIGYSFRDYVVQMYEIRPRWDNKDEKITIPIAKSRYYKSKNIWKIYWKRANGKWELYEPNEEVRDLAVYLNIVDEDTHGCFWG